jgi:uncharacterized protein YoaH (UPF0181 family)
MDSVSVTHHPIRSSYLRGPARLFRPQSRGLGVWQQARAIPRVNKFLAVAADSPDAVAVAAVQLRDKRAVTLHGGGGS